MTGLRIIRNTPKDVNASRFYSIHTHSRFSYNDALPTVEAIVAKAKELGYPGLGLTDHGNMAGSVKLYTECMKAGIKPFPGSEMYLVRDRADKKAKRYHLGLVAYTTAGYRNLVQISTRSYKQFHHKPLIDLADLAEFHDTGLSEGIALTTGCFFGLVTQTLVNDGRQACKQLIATLASWFDTYVEIQQHDIDHGDDVMPEHLIAHELCLIATELDLPVVITQDSHYVEPEDRGLHESLKRLVAFGPDVDDAVFPGDGFHMAEEAWMAAHHAPHILEAGLSGLSRLLGQWDMAIPEMDVYRYRVPQLVADPMGDLRSRTTRALVGKRLLNARYLSRLEEELEVVEAAGMANYLLLVAKVTDHMYDVDMFFQCRGSAAGSLLCWLLNITNVDPLKWKLRFDRFLTKDRTKPPDIDIDVESDRRKELLDWLSENFSVAQIGTFGTYSMSGDEDGKGSLRVAYFSVLRKRGESPEWDEVPEEQRQELYRLSDMELCKGYGVHAAGIILSTSRTELDTQVPLMYVASSKTFVSQYDMKDVEGIGLVKLDALGVKTMSVLRQTIINMGRDPKDGMDFIPLTDAKTFRVIAKGDVDGVFQLEGSTSARYIRRLRPTKIGDVIAAMALFRPGVMASGAMESYLARKHGDQKTPVRHQIIEDATKETFGILLYQDQVIEVLRALGLGVDDLNIFLKAVKASNKNVTAAAATMEKYSAVVQQLCHDAGMTDADVQWLWDALEAFAEYSFNRAHATVYGITAYRCAYLATHHGKHFHAALLAVAAGTVKEAKYITTTRTRGHRLLKADVSYSDRSYSVDPLDRGIRRGLLAIKGIGPAAADAILAARPFETMDEFAEKVNPRIISGVNDYLALRQQGQEPTELGGKLGVLMDAGALASIEGA
jgi:DNA polymerase-3 subunit alpha